MREELKEILRFWKEKGIRAFRFDVINLVSKPERLEDDSEGDGRRFYTDGPHIHEYLKELVCSAGIEDFVTVGEMSSTSLEHCIRYSSPKEKELSMCFNFHHLKVDYKDGDKWTLAVPDYKKLVYAVAAGYAGRRRLECPLLVQSRSASHCKPDGRRRGLLEGVGQDAGRHDPLDEGNPLHLPGRGDWNAECPLFFYWPVPGCGEPELLSDPAEEGQDGGGSAPDSGGPFQR